MALPGSAAIPAVHSDRLVAAEETGRAAVALISKPDNPVGHLGNGDVIGLDDSGRNPEVEEVFSALALLLNGGGVGQLKTISTELNSAFGGREHAFGGIFHPVPDPAEKLDDDTVPGVLLDDLFARHAPRVFGLVDDLVDRFIQRGRGKGRRRRF